MSQGFLAAKRGMVAAVVRAHSATGKGFKRETWRDYTIVRVTNIFRNGRVKWAESITGTVYRGTENGRKAEWNAILIAPGIPWADIEPALKKRRGGGVFNDIDSCKEFLRKFQTPTAEG